VAITVSPWWGVRCEYFGAIALDRSGKSRFLTLNRGAALVAMLCADAPRDERALCALLPSGGAELIDTLRSRGVLIDTTASPVPIEPENVNAIGARMAAAPTTHLTAPFEVNVYTTTRCNVDCEFCYLSRDMRRGYGPSRMSPELLASLLAECKDLGVHSVAFLGGEPMLDQDALLYAVENYRGAFLLSVTTNGTVPPSERLLAALANPGVDVLVSIHSSRSELHDRAVRRRGAWHKAMAMLKRLTAAGVRTGVQTVLNRDSTADDIEALIGITQSSGASGYYVNNLFPGSNMSLRDYAAQVTPRAELGQIAVRLNDLRRQHGDAFYVYSKGTYGFVYADETPILEGPFDDLLTVAADGVTSIEVLSDGSVHAGLLSFNGAAEPVGQLTTDSLAAIWRSEGLAAYRAERPALSEPCSTCKYRSFCKGGNGLISHQLFGQASAGDVRCPIVWDHLQQRGMVPSRDHSLPTIAGE
jgi:Fe-coproporphyrin III synthase